MAINLNTAKLSIIIVLGVFAYFIFILTSYYQNSSGKKVVSAPSAIINNTEINLEIARSAAEQKKGLGYRDSLPNDTGMLFVYDIPQTHTFWMQGMRFALDFLWIENNRIEDIHENVTPPSPGESPLKVSPRIPVRYVLEVNAGFIKEHSIKVGDPVVLKF